MRIAAIMSGRVYGFMDCFRGQHNHIFKGHDVDVFLAHNAANTHDDLRTFMKVYPVKGLTSKPIDVSEYHKYPLDLEGYVDTYYCLIMHQCIRDAFNMIPNPDSYDIILFMRADMHVDEPLKLEIPPENTLYIPEGRNSVGLNDQMAYGRPDVMRQYCSLFSTLHTVLSEPGRKIHPEGLLQNHVNNMNVDLIRFPFEYRLHSRRREKPETLTTIIR